MIICMRTTLVIDDELLRQAKRRAAEQKLTVSDVVNEALRQSLGRQPPVPGPFSLITYGDPGSPVRHEPIDFAEALDREDGSPLR